MIRSDEEFIISGETLSDLEELHEEAYPEEIRGGVILARAKNGTWRLRGTISGYAEWGRYGWRVLHECERCGEEYWDDETPPCGHAQPPQDFCDMPEPVDD